MKYLDVKMKVYSPDADITIPKEDRTVISVKNRGNFEKYDYSITLYTEKFPITLVGDLILLDKHADFFRVIIKAGHESVFLPHGEKIGYVRFEAKGNGDIDLKDFKIIQ